MTEGIVTTGGSEVEATLVTEIRRNYEQAVAAAQDAVDHALKVGADLLKLKEIVPHGQWGDYIDEHFDFSHRTAQRWMQMARNPDKTATVAHLGIKGALAELAEPKKSAPEALPPEPKREDYGDGHLESARFQLDRIDYFADCELAHYREVLDNAPELIADDPVAGSAQVAKAATGIVFLTANREQQVAEGDEWDAGFDKTRTAWLDHRRARDAYYAAVGEPLMDERPLDFFDVYYVKIPWQTDEEQAQVEARISEASR